MNMKSKFFGLNAKLALAVLAVGTMFTGCYDSENGDVVKPYEPADPVYYVAGTITDAETGAPLNAEVTVNGVSATITDGNYSAKGQVGENTVSVKMAGYNNDEAVERKVKIDAVAAGQAYTAVVNVALTKNPSDLDVTVQVLNMQASKANKRLTSAENPGLDLIGEDEGLKINRTFEVVYGFTEPNLEGVSEDLAAYINQYLGQMLGVFGEARKMEVDYEINLYPWTALVAVNLDYDLNEITYLFTPAEGEAATVTVKGVTGYKFSIEATDNHNYSYSHGHGHGHGDNINAGGGIITPEL